MRWAVRRRAQNLILNLDGLAKNLKEIGDGKVWIIGTAQQTLAEDDEKAALNSPLLYKLKDRFPIQIELESGDIKEICYRRLLGKSSAGERQLGALFEQHGQARGTTPSCKTRASMMPTSTAPRSSTSIPSCRGTSISCCGYWPRWRSPPAASACARPSASFRISWSKGQRAATRWPTSAWAGWRLPSRSMMRWRRTSAAPSPPSIRRWRRPGALLRFAHTHRGGQDRGGAADPGEYAGLAAERDQPDAPGGGRPARRDAVDAAIAELIGDAFVPFGEKDGNLCFFSEKLNDIDQERLQIPLRGIDTLRIRHEALRDVFADLPSAQVERTLTVKSGIKALVGAQLYPIAA